MGPTHAKTKTDYNHETHICINPRSMNMRVIPEELNEKEMVIVLSKHALSPDGQPTHRTVPLKRLPSKAFL